MTLSFDKSITEKIDRLINQSKCWEGETDFLFDRIGIQPGWRCLDFGCGPIGVIPSLSKCVGHKGLIIGLDENPYCLYAAKKLVCGGAINKVELLRGNIYSPSLMEGGFDLCHARFIMNEKGCDSELLHNMIKLSRPGGVVVSQESDWTTWKCYPSQPAWTKIRDSMIKFYEIKGGDINAGLRTYQLFYRANLADIRVRSAIMAMPIGHPYRSDMVKFAMVEKSNILNAQILTEVEFDASIQACNRIIDDPSVIIYSYALTQVWGRVKDG